MSKFALLLSLALGGALLVAAGEPPVGFDEQLIRVQAERLLPEHAAALRDEPVEIQALLLDYGDDQPLLLQTRLALLTHPALTRELLLVYGTEPEFVEALRRYGPLAVPPIAYYRRNDIATLTLLDEFGRTIDTLRARWEDRSPDAPSAERPPLTPDLRGWYAVQRIREDGLDFIGQFLVDADGEVQWIQTERFTEAASAFLTSGIRRLETKQRLNEDIGLSDAGWAALDLAIVAGGLKLLRAGKAVGQASKPLSYSRRAALLTPKLANRSRVLGTLAKWGAPAALAYLVVRHPSLLNSMLGELAETFGLPVKAVQIAAWTALLLPLLYLGARLLRLLLWPLRWAGRRAA